MPVLNVSIGSGDWQLHPCIDNPAIRVLAPSLGCHGEALQRPTNDRSRDSRASSQASANGGVVPALVNHALRGDGERTTGSDAPAKGLEGPELKRLPATVRGALEPVAGDQVRPFRLGHHDGSS